ncbi:cytochrome P450 [Frankia sp. AgPm24]|uniref:cytochrome P450 n=1 Tax=Frankia sp. AgPm24 TaxID=631128 RepID=UPI00200CD828|nr:cytochrome P450 [Frankia sp. AgPm24]MCK9922660.1 cytochrome P450 [Frankia sp. AgPm24]
MPVDTFPLAAATRLPPRGSRLPAPIQTFLYGKYRHVLLPRVHQRHGDIFTLKLAQFAPKVVVLAKPADIRNIFTGSASTFHAGYGILGPAMGDHSVILLDEGEHKRVRRLVMPAFTGPALRGYQDMVAQLTKDEVAGWETDRPVNGYTRMQQLTLEVILRVVFGVTDPNRLTEMRPLVYHVASIGPITLLGLSNPLLRRVNPWRRYRARQERLDALLYSEITERRRAKDLESRTDILSRLLVASRSDPSQDGLSDAELRDQLITLLLAGHETTSAALAWTLHELARQPVHLKAAQKAASTGDDEYLSAVAKEILRLRPVVYELARQLAEPVEIGGYRLPAGIAVMPAVGLVHSDSENFPDADSFRPERFIEGQPAANTWIPFGGGARRCVGAGFALMEMTIVLRELLRDFDIRPDRPRPEAPYMRNVTLVPARGARIVLTRRP